MGNTLIQFVGDVHGEWESFDKVVKDSTSHVIIQVGDFGYFPFLGGRELPSGKDSFLRPSEKIPEDGISKVFWIDGNHDDIVSLKTFGFFHPNLQYIPRGEILEFKSTRIAFLGGGVSIDRSSRVEGVNWFREEIPTNSEFNKFFDAVNSGVDIVVTHEMPKSVTNRYLNSSLKCYSEMGEILDKLVKNLDRFPKYWISGHYHNRYSTNLNGIQFLSVPCCHEFQGNPASWGAIINIDK